MFPRKSCLALVAAFFLLQGCSDSSNPDGSYDSNDAIEHGPSDVHELVGERESSAENGANDLPRYSIEQFMDTERVFGASFSADGSRLAFSSNRSGVINVHAQPLDGGEAQSLTHSETDARSLVSFFPHDDRLLFQGDRGGDELNHIYLLTEEGEIIDLTPGEKLRASFAGFSADGDRFWIATNERDRTVMDYYEYDATSLERELIMENTAGAFPGPVSPDGRYIALNRVHIRSNTDVLLFDRETGHIETLIADEGEVANSAATFSADSSRLYYRSDRGHEFSFLVSHELSSGEEQVVLKLDWDVMNASRSRGGRYLVTGINEDSSTRLMLLEAEGYAPVTIDALPEGNLTSVEFDAEDDRFAFYVSDSRRPSDLYLGRLGEAPEALTRSLNPEIRVEHLVDGEVIRFESYDGLEVPGVLYRPHGASADTPVPALVRVHGGPGGQARIGYNPLNQYLLNHGYAIFDINNRGSSGYGKTFYGLDTRCHGECDLGDVVASKQMLIDLGWVDADRIGIMGGSYGGYMVAAALAFEPEVFEVGVNIFGVTNWIRTLESIPPWWGPQRDALFAEIGHPVEDRERLHRISPLFHADQIMRPMIVLQGANDPRVLQVESDEIVEALRNNDVPVEYVLFPDEGHGFRRRDNEIEGYRAIREFLDIHLNRS